MILADMRDYPMTIRGGATYHVPGELLDELGAALDAARAEPCEHAWISMRNEVIESGWMCIKCNAVRADKPEPSPTNKERALNVVVMIPGSDEWPMAVHNAACKQVAASLTAAEARGLEQAESAVDALVTNIQTDMEKSDSDELAELEDIELGARSALVAIRALKKGR